ncbi:MAG TPA: hypothetical protein VGA36_08490 [Nitriliruptorales bacterium]
MIEAAVFAWLGDEVWPVSPPGFRYPCIRPDGQRAVFGSTQGRSRVWRADLDGGDPQPVTPPEMLADVPTYSFDGDLVVFSGTPDPGPSAIFEPGVNVWVARDDGSDLTRVTSGDHRDVRPSVSPDGSVVAFFSDRAGRFGLWLAPVDGSSGPDLLLDEPVGRPAWSRDGRTIYCFRVLPDGCRAAAVSLADGSLDLLSNDVAHTHGLFHAPDRDVLIAHTSRGRDRMTLWELPLDGGPATELIPPGLEGTHYAHGTRADNGAMTFDHRPGFTGTTPTLQAALTDVPTSCWLGLGAGHDAPRQVS